MKTTEGHDINKKNPDFANMVSKLEFTCHARAFDVIFLPKYHSEPNFIEQCWGYAKRRIYRQKAPSSSEAILEHNIIESLDAVPQSSMRRFATRYFRFIDAYRKGLDGVQAAWSIKKYRHRILPESIMKEFDGFHVRIGTCIG
ncbi:hypothetical protein K503DRAFT_741030 [Rhizopogon vinicolor AM-OR11-026]|uniref:Tc1-like transposase DDE domain-containing protein n=1 Tax=Rhizopogon vinicolor AM-OR11-026 TaxID=1314800 RepID=A0A1B7N0Z9_9AGAM|nr:hypothetical protein K503DRAFT_741030 [Rhizopogon vinicolor AM-OR11-026]